METRSTVEGSLYKWHNTIIQMIDDARKTISKSRPFPFEIWYLSILRIETVEEIQKELYDSYNSDGVHFNNVKYSILDCSTFPEEHKKYFDCKDIKEEGRVRICNYLNIVIDPDYIPSTPKHAKLFLYFRLISLFSKWLKQGDNFCCKEMKKIDEFTGLTFECIGDLDNRFNAYFVFLTNNRIMDNPKLVTALLDHIKIFY